MNKHTIALLLAACVSAGALAQAPAAEPAGVVQSVDGLVTVSQGNTLGNLVKDANVFNNARIVTTSTGATSIKLSNGCVIDLVANQAITIDSKLDCKALVASIQSTTSNAGGVFAASGASGGASYIPPLIGAGLAVGLIASQKSSGS